MNERERTWQHPSPAPHPATDPLDPRRAPGPRHAARDEGDSDEGASRTGEDPARGVVLVTPCFTDLALLPLHLPRWQSRGRCPAVTERSSVAPRGRRHETETPVAVARPLRMLRTVLLVNHTRTARIHIIYIRNIKYIFIP